MVCDAERKREPVSRRPGASARKTATLATEVQVAKLLAAATVRAAGENGSHRDASMLAWLEAGKDVYTHQTCRDSYCHKKTLEQKSGSAAGSASESFERGRRESGGHAARKQPVRSSVRHVHHDRALCLYCQQVESPFSTSKGKSKLHAIQTGAEGVEGEVKLRHSKFVWDYAAHNPSLHIRLLGCTDRDLSTYGPGSGSANPSGALYHKACDTTAFHELRRINTRLEQAAGRGVQVHLWPHPASHCHFLQRCS